MGPLFLSQPPTSSVEVPVVLHGIQPSDRPWLFKIKRKQGVIFCDLLDRLNIAVSSERQNAGRVVIREIVVEVTDVVLLQRRWSKRAKY